MYYEPQTIGYRAHTMYQIPNHTSNNTISPNPTSGSRPPGGSRDAGARRDPPFPHALPVAAACAHSRRGLLLDPRGAALSLPHGSPG